MVGNGPEGQCFLKPRSGRGRAGPAPLRAAPPPRDGARDTAPTPNAPIKGVLQGNKLVLVCANSFTMEVVNKPEILDIVSRKASAKLGTPIRAVAADQTGANVKSEQMERLLDFGRAHSDIVKIKEN